LVPCPIAQYHFGTLFFQKCHFGTLSFKLLPTLVPNLKFLSNFNGGGTKKTKFLIFHHQFAISTIIHSLTIFFPLHDSSLLHLTVRFISSQFSFFFAGSDAAGADAAEVEVAEHEAG